MRNRSLSLLKKNWLVSWLIIAFLCFTTVGVVYAAYTKTSSAKLVVARVGSSGNLFSSNYLQKATSMVDTTVYIDAEDSELVDFVRISNFAQGNPGKAYPRAINYTLSIQLVYQSNGEYVPFSDTSMIGERYIKVRIDGSDIVFGYDESSSSYKNYTSAYTVTCSLAGASPNTDTLRIEYSQNQKALLINPDPDLPKMCLEISATPTPAQNYLDIDPLFGRLDLQLTGQVQSVVWNGYINEDGARDDTGSAPSATLDDYNYVIEGVGVGRITLTWDSRYLELNKDFISELQATVDSSSTPQKSITFNVNSNNISRYDTQFYRTGEPLTNYDTWSEVNGYITCEFTPSN